MSHGATNWAIKQRGLKPATKMVLWHLADRHNKDTGMCNPSQAKLAYDCEMSRAALNGHLSKLEALGLIKRIKRINPQTRRQERTEYQLALDGVGCFEADEPCLKSGHGTDEPSANEPSPDSGLGNDPQTPQKPSPENRHGSVSRKRKKPCPDFGDFRVQNLDTNPVREPGSITTPLTPHGGLEREIEEFRSFFPMSRSGSCSAVKVAKMYAAAVDRHGVEAVHAAGRSYAKTIADTGQLPTSILKFLAPTGLVDDLAAVPVAAVEQIYPLTLGDSPEHLFLDEMREAGLSDGVLRKWAEDGFRFVTSGDVRAAVVEHDINDFQSHFGEALRAKGIGCWNPEFYHKRQQRKRSK